MNSYEWERCTRSGKFCWSAFWSLFLGNIHIFRRLWAFLKERVLPLDSHRKVLSSIMSKGLLKITLINCSSAHYFSWGSKGIQGRRDGGLRTGPVLLWPFLCSWGLHTGNPSLFTLPSGCPCCGLKSSPDSICPQRTISLHWTPRTHIGCLLFEPLYCHVLILTSSGN